LLFEYTTEYTKTDLGRLFHEKELIPELTAISLTFSLKYLKFLCRFFIELILC
jgi:hypothetical protein